jgi:uncharacterized RDD family membrane protein YckC
MPNRGPRTLFPLQTDTDTPMTATMTDTLPDPRYEAEFYDGVLPKRFFAWVIDVVIVLALSLLAVFLTLGMAIFVFPFFYLSIAAVYRSATIASGSATLGMRIMHLQLRGPQGARLSTGEAILHTLSYLTVSAFVIPHLISLGLMAGGARNQGLPDLLIGSAMINRPR